MHPHAPEDNTDEELMERVQSGDTAAYRALFERHHPRVYGFVLRRLGDAQAADDVFQETFLSVYRARGTWQPGRPFRPWLFTIAANLCRDHRRNASRRPEEVSEDQAPPPARALDGGAQLDATLNLERAIASLPEMLREAFLLGVVEGFDHREVAAQLAITPDNARARISRARAWLRAHLDAT